MSRLRMKYLAVRLQPQIYLRTIRTIRTALIVMGGPGLNRGILGSPDPDATFHFQSLTVSFQDILRSAFEKLVAQAFASSHPFPRAITER